jgi:hypothetical protein
MSDDFDLFDDDTYREDGNDDGDDRVGWEEADPMDRYQSNLYDADAATADFGHEADAAAESGHLGGDDAEEAGEDADGEGEHEEEEAIDEDEFAPDDDVDVGADEDGGGGIQAVDEMGGGLEPQTDDALLAGNAHSGPHADTSHEGVDGENQRHDAEEDVAEEEELEYVQEQEDPSGDDPLIAMMANASIEPLEEEDDDSIERISAAHAGLAASSASTPTGPAASSISGGGSGAAAAAATSTTVAMAQVRATPRLTPTEVLERSFRTAQHQYDGMRRHLAGSVAYEQMLDAQVALTHSPAFRSGLDTLVNQPADVQTHMSLVSMFQIQSRVGYQPTEGEFPAQMLAEPSGLALASVRDWVDAEHGNQGSHRRRQQRPRRIQETTVQMPDSAFALSRHNTDNLIKSQFAVQMENVFLLWRTFCSIHERMRRRQYALLRGYPPMNFAAFVRTFCMTPEQAGPGVPQWINRAAPSAAMTPAVAAAATVAAAAAAAATASRTLPDGAFGTPAIPHSQLYMSTVELPSYELHRLLSSIDVAGIKRKLSSLYFMRAALFSTDQRPAGPLHAAFDMGDVYVGSEHARADEDSPEEKQRESDSSRSYPYHVETVGGPGSEFSMPLEPPSESAHVQLRLTANESDTIYVCFLDGADTRMISKRLTFERSNNASWPMFMWNPKIESTMAPKNERIPIAEFFVITDKEPNDAFRTKIRDLHSKDMPANMQCIIDVWGQETLWINPSVLQMVDRMEIVTDRYPPRIHALLSRNQVEAATKTALTLYNKMMATDVPLRWIGARPGNFIRSWKTATKNSHPTLSIVL